MAKKKQPAGAGAERKARVEALKKQQKAKERKKTVVLIGVAAVLGAALIAVPVVQIVRQNAEANQAFVEYGAPLSAAGCDEVEVDADAEGTGDHKADGTQIDYEESPPSHGSHWQLPAQIDARAFYAPEDTPELERLVHNLEHGYTVAWYTPALPKDQLDELTALAERLRGEQETRKFIAAPWDPANGEFPSGKPMALSHWGMKDGYRQYCSGLSGEAVKSFMDKYPASNSPEPNTV